MNELRKWTMWKMNTDEWIMTNTQVTNGQVANIHNKLTIRTTRTSDIWTISEKWISEQFKNEQLLSAEHVTNELLVRNEEVNN